MNIKFNPVSENHEKFCPYPKPAKEYLPQWFKSLHAFEDKKISITDSGLIKGTAKLCMPFTDTFTMGYIQETWCDIYIDINDSGTLSYKWSTDPQIIKIRKENYGSFPALLEMYPIEFCWTIPWMPELPKGYSALLTNPLNRPDLPFYTVSGVLESDSYKYGLNNNQMPFFIKNGFTGLIPTGTPMYQILPIKRETWKGSTNKYNKSAQELENFKVRKKFWGGYKKEHWVKKQYDV